VALFVLSTNFPLTGPLRFVTEAGNVFECGFGGNVLQVLAQGDFNLIDTTGRLIRCSTFNGAANIPCLVGIPNATLRLDDGQPLEVFSAVAH
jgi:hypothetical protein